MKTGLKLRGEIGPADVVVLLGLTVGLGIAVHQSFFLVAGAIALGAALVGTARARSDRVNRRRLALGH